MTCHNILVRAINDSKAERKTAEILRRKKRHGDWSVMDADLVWVDDIHKTRNIFDFSKRQDSDAYRQSLEWLLGDLKIQNR